MSADVNGAPVRLTGLEQLKREVNVAAARSQPWVLLDSLAREFGPRPCGSEAARGASARLASLLDEAGARAATRERVPLDAWGDAPAKVRVTTAGRSRSLPAIQHVYSAAARIEGTLVIGGAGNPVDLDRVGDRIAGSILLLRGYDGYKAGEPPLWCRTADAQRRGAAGILVRGTYSDSGPEIQLAHVDSTLPIPVVGIAKEDELALEREIEGGVGGSALVETGGRAVPSHCFNVVAEFGPADAATDAVVLTAHLDCQHNSVGALDNLSGTACVVELCRALAPFQQHFRRTLRALIFTGEEYGYLGSRTYTAAHEHELGRVALDFNLDCLFPETADGVAVMGAPSVHELVRSFAHHANPALDVRSLFCASSDYLSFMLRGVPAARAADFYGHFPENRMHTPFDTPDHLPASWLASNVAAFAPVLLEFLSAPEFRPQRMGAEAVRDWFTSSGAGEVYRILSPLPPRLVR